MKHISIKALRVYLLNIFDDPAVFFICMDESIMCYSCIQRNSHKLFDQYTIHKDVQEDKWKLVDRKYATKGDNVWCDECGHQLKPLEAAEPPLGYWPALFLIKGGKKD